MPNLETIHQNILEPRLDAVLILPNYGQTKLSYNPPYNTGTITFSCNKAYDRFVARVTYGDEIISPEHGVLVTELNGAAANQEQSFSFDTRLHLPEKTGAPDIREYHLNMYVQDGDTIWNYEYRLFDEDSEQVYTSDNEKVYVMAKGAILVPWVIPEHKQAFVGGAYLANQIDDILELE